jgi:hypothetical protein
MASSTEPWKIKDQYSPVVESKSTIRGCVPHIASPPPYPMERDSGRRLFGALLIAVALISLPCALSHRGHTHSAHAHHDHDIAEGGHQHAGSHHRHLHGHSHSHSHSHAKNIKLGTHEHHHDATAGDAHSGGGDISGTRQWWQATANGGVTPALKAALALFVEAFIGVLIPLLVKGA